MMVSAEGLFISKSEACSETQLQSERQILRYEDKASPTVHIILGSLQLIRT
jgi:hypothetical protein